MTEITELQREMAHKFVSDIADKLHEAIDDKGRNLSVSWGNVKRVEINSMFSNQEHLLIEERD